MQRVTLLEQLPVDLNRGIGRVISAHALLEHHLGACIATLTGLGHKERRLVLAEMTRSETRLQIIKSLISVHNLNVAIPAPLTGTNLKRIREDRNLLAHGVWTDTAQGYAVIQTAGEWPKESGLGSRKIKPAAVTTDATALDALLATITGLRKAAEQLRDRVDAALAVSPRKPR